MKLTLFSTCKPFKGHIGVIQRNAFRNWASFRQTRVIIFGDEEGVREASARWGFTHEGGVELGPQGYPLIPAMFRRAHELHPASVYLYTNSDMIYWGMENALNRLVEEFPEFLMVGTRRDIRVNEELTFEEGWVKDLRSRGGYHPPCGIDYFGFTPNLWTHIPNFQVGNVGFDNWLVVRALKQGKPVVDATGVIDAFHQEHPRRTSENRPGDLHNLELFEGDRRRLYGWVTHASWVMSSTIEKKT